MTFISPWRHRLFCDAVAGLRALLAPFGDLEGRLIRALIRAHNRRVARYLDHRPPESLLLIMPRCLRRSGCDAPVRENLTRCLTCTECPLGDIARLADDFDVRALVAYRSHIAFALARREKPDLILATACEDRLIKALREVPEVPALLSPLVDTRGVVGSCRNTLVDLDWLRRQLEKRAEPLKAPSRKAGKV